MTDTQPVDIDELRLIDSGPDGQGHAWTIAKQAADELASLRAKVAELEPLFIARGEQIAELYKACNKADAKIAALTIQNERQREALIQIEDLTDPHASRLPDNVVIGKVQKISEEALSLPAPDPSKIAEVVKAAIEWDETGQGDGRDLQDAVRALAALESGGRDNG